MAAPMSQGVALTASAPRASWAFSRVGYSSVQPKSMPYSRLHFWAAGSSSKGRMA